MNDQDSQQKRLNEVLLPSMNEDQNEDSAFKQAKKFKIQQFEGSPESIITSVNLHSSDKKNNNNEEEQISHFQQHQDQIRENASIQQLQQSPNEAAKQTDDVNNSKIQQSLAIMYLMNNFYEFEEKNKAFAWLYYLILALTLCCLLFHLEAALRKYDSNFQQLGSVEYLFTSSLVTFVLNYILIRIGMVEPFFHKTRANVQAKIAGLFCFMFLICFMYALTTPASAIVTMMGFLGWIFCLAIDALFFQMKLSWIKLGYLTLSALGVAAILQPDFVECKDQLTLMFQNEAFTSYQKGLITGCAGTTILVLTVMLIKKIPGANILTLNHVICLFVVLLFPAFFPMQNIISPSPQNWVFLLVCGMVATVICLMLLRAIQLQRPTYVLQFLSLGFVIKMLFFDLLFSSSTHHTLIEYVGCILVGLATSQLSLIISHKKILNPIQTGTGTDRKESVVPASHVANQIELLDLGRPSKNQLRLSQELFEESFYYEPRESTRLSLVQQQKQYYDNILEKNIVHE